MALVNEGNKGTQAVSGDAKKEAAKKFSERRAAQKKAQYEGALKFRDHLKAKNVQIEPEDQAWLDNLCTAPGTRTPAVKGTAASPVFAQIFGVSPKVGDKVTLQVVVNKTFKGIATMKLLLKRWADKGTVVEFVENKNDMMQSTYVIKALPAA